MSAADVEERPPKKRRFFVEDPPVQEKPAFAQRAPPDAGSGTYEGLSHPAGHQNRNNDGVNGEDAVSCETFSRDLFQSFTGVVLSESAFGSLRKAADDDMEKGINMYLDGSWKDPRISESNGTVISASQAGLPTRSTHTQGEMPKPGDPNIVAEKPLDIMPNARYIGSFGVGAWATRSGPALIKHGDPIRIERTRIQPPTKVGRGGKIIQTSKAVAARARTDIIVRFTTLKGEELGRLPQDTAAWVAPLMDQRICHFEGTCVFAPERIRVNDTVYLQIRCSLLKSAFANGRLKSGDDTNRTTGIFEEKETSEEKDLRLRQVALVKVFTEIGLQPRTVNETTAKHKREGILQAAEIAEQYDQDKDRTPIKSTQGGQSPPTAEAEEEEDGKELEQDQLDSLYKKAQSFDFDTPAEEPSETFAMNLRKYQKQALYWMMKKEKDESSEHKERSMHPLWEEYRWPSKDADDKDLPLVSNQDAFYVNPYSGEMSPDFPAQEQHCRGGILADEMGLGKTIEMLSLMHSHRSELATQASDTRPTTVNSLPRLPKSSSSVEPAPATTLVVAPMSLLAQWDNEASKASKTGSFKSMVYYGSEKAVDLRNLCCEANAASAPNLIITSYGVVLSEFGQVARNGGDRGSHGGIFSLDFFRVILDEAHFIKNRQSKTAKACYEIAAQHRWVLTGTPIINRLEDLFSLVHFLRVEPWSNFSFWKTFITTPFESGDFIRALDVVQTVLEPLVLRRTKDMKTPDGEALVPLPARSIVVEELQFSKQEREVYDYIFMRAKRTFNATMEAGTLLKSYTTIFAQILRLRQSCCHPILTRNKSVVAEEEDAAAAADIANGLADDMDLQELIERFTSDSEEQDISNRYGAHVLQQIQTETAGECPICSEEPMIDPAVTGCWHSACKKCLLSYIDHQKEKETLPLCFNCRELINQRDVFEVIRHDMPNTNDDDLYSTTPNTPSSPPRISLSRIGNDASAKIAALTAHLKAIRLNSPSTKSVVFSQFTSFLDLIAPALTRAGIPYVRFDGAMTQKARAAVITEFSDSKKGFVMLLSLRAGGVGLNLTAANHVFMMDPWWSFAVEAQAIDRVHRMGQENEVKVVRFVVEGSIEGRMLRIQERKKFM